MTEYVHKGIGIVVRENNGYYTLRFKYHGASYARQGEDFTRLLDLCRATIDKLQSEEL